MILQQQLLGILEALQEMQEDSSVPKSVKLRLTTISATLHEGGEFSLRVHKVMAVLDELQENNNLQAFTRTQLYNIASMLEVVQG